jgi:hypothetical protein
LCNSIVFPLKLLDRQVYHLYLLKLSQHFQGDLIMILFEVVAEVFELLDLAVRHSEVNRVDRQAGVIQIQFFVGLNLSSQVCPLHYLVAVSLTQGI